MTSSITHLEQQLDPATLDSLSDFICGDTTDRFPVYRSSSYLTRFFQSIGISAKHDGSTRKWWVLEVLKRLRPSELEKVILRLVDMREYKGVGDNFRLAARSMNDILAMESLAIGFNGTQPILRRAEALQLDEIGIFSSAPVKDEADFLSKQFEDEIKIGELGLDAVTTSYLQARVDEAQACPKGKVTLGTIFLLGSTLEGMLLAMAIKSPAKYMSSKAAPKDKSGKVKKVYEWKLSELIDVAYETGKLGLDVKKFSHVLRDFRNYIHPLQQMSQSFSPDQHTVEICWQVFKAAFSQLKTPTL